MARPIDHFAFCPKCGARLAAPTAPNRIQCGRCGFRYYFNPTVSAAAIVLGPDGRAVLLRRSKEPAQGKLALPGGFVDFGETAEDALRRETREEVGLELECIEFLCSQPNDYSYRGVTYPVVDVFFTARAVSTQAVPLDGAASVCWLDPLALDLEELAFPSVRRAMQVYRRQAAGRTSS